MKPLLEIRNLRAGIDGKEILKGIDLQINAGEIHAIMGPNGSGKSTLAQVIAGHPSYEVYEGEILFEGDNILELEPEERAQKGIFLAFQAPVEIPGVPLLEFLKTALNELRESRGEEPVDTMTFLNKVRGLAKEIIGKEDVIYRGVNEGFSGGERKRNEILQMRLLEPRFAVLDEIDSGLDIDALKLVAKHINEMRNPERAFLLITHYYRILEHVKPDVVHVLYDGKIVRSGDYNLALEVEEKGYDWLLETANA